MVNLRNRIRVFFTDVDGRQSLDMISSFPTTSVGDTLSLHPSVLAFQQDRLSTTAEPDSLIIEMFYCLRSPESCENTASKKCIVNPSKGLSLSSYRTAKSKRELTAKNKTGMSNTSSQHLNIAQPVREYLPKESCQNGKNFETTAQLNNDKNKTMKLNGNVAGNFYQMNNHQLNNVPNSTISEDCDILRNSVQLMSSEFSQSLWNQMGSESMTGEYKNDPTNILASSHLGECSAKIGNSQNSLFSPIRRFSWGKENGTAYSENENTLDIVNKVACGMIDVNDMDFGCASASTSAPSSSTYKHAEHSGRLKSSAECYRNVLNPPRDILNPNTNTTSEVLTTDRTANHKQEQLEFKRVENKCITDLQQSKSDNKDKIQHEKEMKKRERTGSEDVHLVPSVSTDKNTSVTDGTNSPLSYNISTFEFPTESLIMFDGGIYESRDLNALQNLSTNDLFPSSKSQNTPLRDENKNGDVIGFPPSSNDGLNFFSNIGESIGFIDSAFRSMVPEKNESGSKNGIENENENENENGNIGVACLNAALETDENNNGNTYKETSQTTNCKNVCTYDNCSPVHQLDAGNAIILFSTSSNCEISPSGYSFSAFPDLFLDSPECSVDRRVPLSLYFPRKNNEIFPEHNIQNNNVEYKEGMEVDASDVPIDIPQNILQSGHILQMRNSHESIYEKVKNDYENENKIESEKKNEKKNENDNKIPFDNTRGVQKDKSEEALSISIKMKLQSDDVLESRSRVPVQTIIAPNEQKDLGSNSTSNSVDSGSGVRLFGFIEKIDEMRKKNEIARLSPILDIRNSSQYAIKAHGEVGGTMVDGEEEKVGRVVCEQGKMMGMSRTENASMSERVNENMNKNKNKSDIDAEDETENSKQRIAKSEKVHESSHYQNDDEHEGDEKENGNGNEKPWKGGEDRGCTFHTSSLSGLSSSNRGENNPNVIFTTSNTTSASDLISASASTSTSTIASQLKSLAQVSSSIPSSGSKKRKNISDYFTRKCVKKENDNLKNVRDIISNSANQDESGNIEIASNEVEVHNCGNNVENINNCEIKQLGLLIEEEKRAEMMDVQCDNHLEEGKEKEEKEEKENSMSIDVNSFENKNATNCDKCREKDDETETESEMELECRTDKSSSSSLLTNVQPNTVLGIVDPNSSSDSNSEDSSLKNATTKTATTTAIKDKLDVFNMFYTEINSTTFISSRIKKVRSSRVAKRITPTFLVPLSQKRKYLEFLTFENSFKFSL